MHALYYTGTVYLRLTILNTTVLSTMVSSTECLLLPIQKRFQTQHTTHSKTKWEKKVYSSLSRNPENNPTIPNGTFWIWGTEMISVIYIRKEHFRIFIRIRYSKILYKIQVKFTIAYPDENPKMHFSNVNHWYSTCDLFQLNIDIEYVTVTIIKITNVILNGTCTLAFGRKCVGCVH
jgi:hypothetical protein